MELGVGLLEGLWQAYKSDAAAIDTRGLTTLWRDFGTAFEYTFARLSTEASRTLIGGFMQHADAPARCDHAPP